MSLPVALQPERSLAAALRELAALALAGAPTCPWCGSAGVGTRALETWPPQTVLMCDECGSETALERRLTSRAARS